MTKHDGELPFPIPEGARMRPQVTWAISGICDPCIATKHLDMLFSDDVVLYVEDITQDETRIFLEQHQIEAKLDIAKSSVGPAVEISFGGTQEPNIKMVETEAYHLPLTRKILDGLCELYVDVAHILVYDDGIVVMEWHDIHFNDSRMYIVGTMPEDRIARFCQIVACRYEHSDDCCAPND